MSQKFSQRWQRRQWRRGRIDRDVGALMTYLRGERGDRVIDVHPCQRRGAPGRTNFRGGKFDVLWQSEPELGLVCEDLELLIRELQYFGQETQLVMVRRAVD